jgi:hypothetical protein
MNRNYLVTTLRNRAEKGEEAFFTNKYRLEKTNIYLHLNGFENHAIQSIVYKLKNYGMNVLFGEPKLDGKISFVVISDNLLNKENNNDFLQAIGQGRFLDEEEKEESKVAAERQAAQAIEEAKIASIKQLSK